MTFLTLCLPPYSTSDETPPQECNDGANVFAIHLLHDSEYDNSEEATTASPLTPPTTQTPSSSRSRSSSSNNKRPHHHIIKEDNNHNDGPSISFATFAHHLLHDEQYEPEQIHPEELLLREARRDRRRRLIITTPPPHHIPAPPHETMNELKDARLKSLSYAGHFEKPNDNHHL